MRRITNDQDAHDAASSDEMEGVSPAAQAVMARLRAYSRPVPRDPTFIARLRAELVTAAADAGVATRAARSRRRGWSLRTRLISVATALLLALSAVAGYLRLNNPTPVSAQAILQRAAGAPALPSDIPNQVIHQVSTVSTVLKLNVDPLDTTVDQWIQLDAAGTIVRRIATVHSITGALVARFLDTSATEQIYDASGNTIFTDKLPQGAGPWTRDPSGMAYARQLLLSTQQNNGQAARLLPRQTLGGVTVDVVALDDILPSNVPATARFVSQRLAAILYIDARTYAIRGLDLNEVDGGASSPAVTMRVTAYDTVPLSRLPAGTFSLSAPANAQIWHPGPPPAGVPAHTLASSVAGAVAVPGQPALLLSGDLAGLRFHGVSADVQQDGTTATAYGYGPPLRVADEGGGPVAADGIGGPSPTARSFSVQINHVPASEAGQVPLGWGMRGGQPMTVTIAGQIVQAQYWEDTYAPAIHQLLYRQGTSWVMIISYGLSKDEFLAAVGALVDARARPDVVAQAQHELDVWNYEVHATIVATEGLCSTC